MNQCLSFRSDSEANRISRKLRKLLMIRYVNSLEPGDCYDNVHSFMLITPKLLSVTKKKSSKLIEKRFFSTIYIVIYVTGSNLRLHNSLDSKQDIIFVFALIRTQLEVHLPCSVNHQELQCS